MARALPSLAVLGFLLVISGCEVVRHDGRSWVRNPETPPERIQTGRASWYGARFAGRPTASGEIFDPEAMTAAHRSLPFGTMVRVTNLENGRSILLRINDRGPFIRGRILDCSRGAARKLGFLKKGLAQVALDRPRGSSPQ